MAEVQDDDFCAFIASIKVDLKEVRRQHAFLLRLGNALRVVRGSAKDVCLPLLDDDRDADFMCLCRRMDFHGKEDSAESFRRALKGARATAEHFYAAVTEGLLKVPEE